MVSALLTVVCSATAGRAGLGQDLLVAGLHQGRVLVPCFYGLGHPFLLSTTFLLLGSIHAMSVDLDLNIEHLP